MKECCEPARVAFPLKPVEYAHLVGPLPLKTFWKYLECNGRPKGPPRSKNPNESLPKTTGGKKRVSSSPVALPGQGWAGGVQPSCPNLFAPYMHS